MSAAYALLLLGFGLATVARIAHAQNCLRPEGGPNMILAGSNTFPVSDGTKVIFKCETGYKAEGGSGDVTCLKGTWTALRMICIRKNCGSPGEVTNGHINYDEGTEFGDKITITCDTGYILVGRNEITCGNQGWLDRLPVCEVVVCSPPASIGNGSFTPVKEHYEYSEVVQYSCQGDYVLNGSKELTCKENRQFEPGPPTCVYVQCNNPDINNGQWVSGSRPPYKHMSSVTLRCNLGHNMNGSGTVTCDINSQWAPPLPECKPIVCKVPEVKDGEAVDGAKPSYKYLETVTFKCKTGFEMKGQSTLTCKENNQWSHEPPVCAVDSGNTGHQTTPIVLGVLGVLGAIVAGICIFCRIQKKKKGKLDRHVVPS